MGKQFVLAVWLVLFVTDYSSAAPFSYTWRIEDLAGRNAETIELRDKNNRLLKRIDTKQMIYLYSVMQAIEEVTELRSELLITDGEHSQCFCHQGHGGTGTGGKLLTRSREQGPDRRRPMIQG